MAKPEAWRLDPLAYPVSLVMQTRFQDMDVNKHLNNVAYAALFENARADTNRLAGLQQHVGQGVRTMVVNVDINYLAEGRYPDDVTIYSGIGKIGTSSWSILQAMFQKGRCIATCDNVIVCRGETSAAPLRQELRAELEKMAVRKV